MKTLLIPFLMVAAALTANAHCGTCGTGDAHVEKKACAEDCAKACCAKEKKAAKEACPVEKKACADDCAKACCEKPAKAAEAAKPAKAVKAAAPLAPCCAAK